MFLCRNRKPNWIISFQTNLNLSRGLPKLPLEENFCVLTFAGHSVSKERKRNTYNKQASESIATTILPEIFMCDALTLIVLLQTRSCTEMCLDNRALKAKDQVCEQRGGGSAATGEWYSTAVLYRFSTAIIKSVRHSTSYFLPTFPLIQTWLSHCAFWPKRCTGGSYFHSIRHTVSLYFLLSGDFFTVLSKPTVPPSQRYFLPLKYQQSVPFWLETIQSDCTPLTLCHTDWTEQIPFFLPFY